MTKRNPYVSDKWPGTLHRKIDVYDYAGKYLYSSNAYKTVKDAENGAMFEGRGKVHAHYSD